MKDTHKQVDWSKWDSKENCFAKYDHVRSDLIYGKLPNKVMSQSMREGKELPKNQKLTTRPTTSECIR